MDDKKRKKFGLSLKNSKKIAVAKSEVNKPCSIWRRNAPSSTISKEIEDIDVVDTDKNNSLQEQEQELSKNVKTNLINCFETEYFDNDDEERTLWKNLLSGKSSKSYVNWETMEDLPKSNVPLTSLMAERASSSTNKDNGIIFGWKTNQEMEALNIQFDYKDLPKPCIACYTRHSNPLVWSCDEKDCQDGKSSNEENKNNITPDETKSSIDIINVNNNINNCSKEHLYSTNLFQSSYESHNSDSLKIPWKNRKPALKYSNEKVECKKFIYKRYPNNSKMLKSISECPAFEDKCKSFKENSTLDLKTTNSTNTLIDLSNDEWEQRPSCNKRKKCGDILPINKPPSTKRHTIYEKNGNSITTPGYFNAGLKSGSGMRFTGELERKGKDIPMKKEILNCCPMCQLYFPKEMNTQGIDQHISNCIGNEEVFIDDEDEDW